MGKRDPRVTAYIKKSQPFARPILTHLRAVVHEGCPDAREAIKWGMPFYDYQGMFCSMAAFKQHVAFGFWRTGLAVKGAKPDEAMGQFGRLTSVDDLPSRATLLKYVKQAVKLRDARAKAPKPAPRMKRPAKVTVPAFLRAALARNARAKQGFDGMPPSHRREYVAWLTDAKTDATRARRLATALTWMAAGKSQSGKYGRRKPS